MKVILGYSYYTVITCYAKQTAILQLMSQNNWALVVIYCFLNSYIKHWSSQYHIWILIPITVLMHDVSTVNVFNLID